MAGSREFRNVFGTKSSLERGRQDGGFKQGQMAEDRVAIDMSARGWRVIYQNQKFAGVEVDLVLAGACLEILLIEVKSLKSQEYAEQRVSRTQKRRVCRAACFLEGFLNRPVCLLFAFVNSDHLTISYYDFLGESWDPRPTSVSKP